MQKTLTLIFILFYGLIGPMALAGNQWDESGDDNPPGLEEYLRAQDQLDQIPTQIGHGPQLGAGIGPHSGGGNSYTPIPQGVSSTGAREGDTATRQMELEAVARGEARFVDEKVKDDQEHLRDYGQVIKHDPNSIEGKSLRTLELEAIAKGSKKFTKEKVLTDEERLMPTGGSERFLKLKAIADGKASFESLDGPPKSAVPPKKYNPGKQHLPTYTAKKKRSVKPSKQNKKLCPYCGKKKKGRIKFAKKLKEDFTGEIEDDFATDFKDEFNQKLTFQDDFTGKDVKFQEDFRQNKRPKRRRSRKSRRPATSHRRGYSFSVGGGGHMGGQSNGNGKRNCKKKKRRSSGKLKPYGNSKERGYSWSHSDQSTRRISY